jgi:hypothetical protein
VDGAAFGARLDDATRSLTGLLQDRADAVIVHQITAADPAVADLLPAR